MRRQLHLLCLPFARRLAAVVAAGFALLGLGAGCRGAGRVAGTSGVARRLGGMAVAVPGSDLDNIDDAAEAIPLDALVDDDTPRDGAEALEPPFAGEAPDAQEVDDIGRAAEGKGRLGLAADEKAAAAGGTDEAGQVCDEVCAAARVGGEELGIADLEADTAGDGGHAGLGAEVKGKMDRQVEGDDGDVEGQAGVLKGLFGQGPDGEDVVDGGEGGEAVIRGGRVGEEEGGAVEDMGQLLGGRGASGGGQKERGERRDELGGEGELESVVEGYRGVAEGGGEGEGLEEAVGGRGGRPGEVEVVEHDSGGGGGDDDDWVGWSGRPVSRRRRTRYNEMRRVIVRIEDVWVTFSVGRALDRDLSLLTTLLSLSLILILTLSTNTKYSFSVVFFLEPIRRN